MAQQFLKLVPGWDEDDKIAQLPDLAQLVWIKTLSRAKRQRPGGTFGSVEHLKALLPDRLHKHIKVLVSAGLLIEEQGRLVVANWSRYQVDPTAPERKARWIENQGTLNDRSENGKERIETKRHRDIETKRLTKEVNTRARTGDLTSAFEIITGRKG
jgi:hypothetical protein